MAKFTKYNNPSRKRRRRKLSYNVRTELAIKDMLIDRRLGYDLPISYYEEKWRGKEVDA